MAHRSKQRVSYVRAFANTSHRAAAVFLTSGATSIAACSDKAPPPPGAERALIALDAFEPLDPSEDPLPSHRPPEVDCSALTGWFVEDDHLEMDTARCNYVSLAQPALVGAAAGARVTGTLSHFDLTAAGAAEAHVAFFLDGVPLWERTIAVPGIARVYQLDVPLEREFETGAPVVVHLHNHGQNTWQLFGLDVTSE
jgi:hypothetical protein